MTVQGRKNLLVHLRKDHRIKTCLRDYFNGTDFDLDEDLDEELLNKIEKKKKKKLQTPRKPKKVLEPKPTISEAPKEENMMLGDANETARANAAFEKTLNFFSSLSKQKVLVLPVGHSETSWELCQSMQWNCAW